MTFRKRYLGVLLLPVLGYLSMFNYVEAGDGGLAWNPLTGEITLQETGFHFTSPLTMVATVELRPQRVCVSSTVRAAPNCRLAQFDKARYKDFVATEGWSYYWLRNRLSFNTGYSTYRGFRDVLRGYAFSSKPYPFVKILSD